MVTTSNRCWLIHLRSLLVRKFQNQSFRCADLFPGRPTLLYCRKLIFFVVSSEGFSLASSSKLTNQLKIIVSAPPVVILEVWLNRTGIRALPVSGTAQPRDFSNFTNVAILYYDGSDHHQYPSDDSNVGVPTNRLPLVETNLHVSRSFLSISCTCKC